MISSKINIVMGVYDGGKFLRQQIDSIIHQTHEDWCLHLAVDSARDDSREIIEHYQKKLGPSKISTKDGSGKGFFKTFLKLLGEVEPDAHYAAFCDQDDFWHPNKLSTAVQQLESLPPNLPAIYCGRTRIVDSNGNHLGSSPLFSRKPGFRNALVQSIAGGNTMVLNRSAIDLLNQNPIVQTLPGHDWWAYLLVTGAGGLVVYDPIAKVDYRQHANNLIGSNLGWKNRYVRIKRLFSGRYRRWIDQNLAALASIESCLTPENRQLFQEFAILRNSNAFARILLIQKLKLRRQTTFGTISLYVGLLLNRV